MLRSTAYQSKLRGFIVDEAHCVTKWQVDESYVAIYVYSASVVTNNNISDDSIILGVNTSGENFLSLDKFTV